VKRLLALEPNEPSWGCWIPTARELWRMRCQGSSAKARVHKQILHGRASNVRRSKRMAELERRRARKENAR
jgi:hypothetical protein